MYDTAARVQEVADLTMGSLRIESEPYTIKIIGKGRKGRIVPLSKEQVEHLRSYIEENATILSTYSSPLFQNSNGTNQSKPLEFMSELTHNQNDKLSKELIRELRQSLQKIDSGNVTKAY